MSKFIKVKTSRTRSGEARAKISRYLSSSNLTGKKEIHYSFTFYRNFKWFQTHDELRNYIINEYNYDIGELADCWQ